MSLSANIERFRVTEMLGSLRIGGQTAPRLKLAGECQRPVEIFARGLPDKLMSSFGKEKEGAQVIWLETRCRKCPPCLTKRSQLWAARAIDELALATRTWFGTFTLTPAQAMRAQFAAQRLLALRGHKLSEVSDAELFRATSHQVTRELTLWLKRIRKNSGARIRYLLVCEAHKSGVPHWHVLVHEYEGKVVKRELEASWRYGISHFRLIDQGDKKYAYYCAKYLSKSALTRVRASKHYGTPPVGLITDQVENLVQSLWSSGVPHQEHPPGNCETQKNTSSTTSFSHDEGTQK